jgi:hypothetical protein
MLRPRQAGHCRVLRPSGPTYKPALVLHSWHGAAHPGAEAPTPRLHRALHPDHRAQAGGSSIGRRPGRVGGSSEGRGVGPGDWADILLLSLGPFLRRQSPGPVPNGRLRTTDVSGIAIACSRAARTA